MYKTTTIDCRRWKQGKGVLAFCLAILFSFLTSPLWAEPIDLTELSIEELMAFKVTSVSKKEQNLSDSAAAIFVITNEDLRQSGATGIADALRMVPGLNVAQIDSNKWAVNSRGSTSRFADKLLVLVDGRSVYTPRFSGVYWEVQDLLMEDVDRIEVIRGPGATLWGANAVNGVINIMTKSAANTQGGLVDIGGGNQERSFAGARYGVALGEGTHGRLYAKYSNKDELKYSDGDKAGDGWDILHSGFRLDSTVTAKDSLTMHGDIYRSDIDQQLDLPSLTWTSTEGFGRLTRDNATASGGNLVARWQHTLAPDSDFVLQAYYDSNERNEAFEKDKQDSFDLDFQHRLAAGDRHDILWGARYRLNQSDFTNTPWLVSTQEDRSENLYSLFLQDEIMLFPKLLWLTVGSKLEHNESSGYEVQPSARLRLTPYEKHTLWAAVSRAVRTPSQVEQFVRMDQKIFPNPLSFDPTSMFFNPANPMPIKIVMNNDPDFESEKMIAYEVGYRVVPASNISVDFAIFYNDYDKMREYAPQAPVFNGVYIEQLYQIKNAISAHSYGSELAIAWEVNTTLKLDLAYSYLDSDIDEGGQFGHEPRHQTSLRGAVKLRHDLDLNFWLRYVDNVNAVYLGSASGWYEIDEYTTLDLRLAWRPAAKLELSLVGKNLLESNHMEFVQENWIRPTEVGRGFYGKMTYAF